jgi:hypothetical protein
VVKTGYFGGLAAKEIAEVFEVTDRGCGGTRRKLSDIVKWRGRMPKFDIDADTWSALNSLIDHALDLAPADRIP